MDKHRKPRGRKADALVLAQLASAERPLTAYQLLDQLREEGLSAPPTVYRALDRLVAEGRVHRLESLHAFVACTHDDHCGFAAFAICRECGLATEFADAETADALARWADGQEFRVDRTTVEMIGVCAACRERAAADPR